MDWGYILEYIYIYMSMQSMTRFSVYQFKASIQKAASDDLLLDENPFTLFLG